MLVDAAVQVCHWVWSTWVDSSGVTNSGWIKSLGVIDFAGGTVVHITSGFSGLAACLVLGQRKVIADGDGNPPPHSTSTLFLGGAVVRFCLIWRSISEVAVAVLL